MMNLTADPVWTYFTRPDLPGLHWVTRFSPNGGRNSVTPNGPGCLHMDRFVIVVEDPETVDDPPVLFELDLDARPMCEDGKWLFDGDAFREDRTFQRVR